MENIMVRNSESIRTISEFYRIFAFGIGEISEVDLILQMYYSHKIWFGNFRPLSHYCNFFAPFVTATVIS